LCALRVGERHRLGFRGFAISRLAGFREIPRSRIILRHLQEPCHDAAPLRPPCLCPDPPRNELLTAASSSPRAPRYRSPGRGWLGAPGLYSALVWSHRSANYLDPVSRRSLASLLQFVGDHPHERFAKCHIEVELVPQLRSGRALLLHRGRKERRFIDSRARFAALSAKVISDPPALASAALGSERG
jgi:hypothetical protein